MVPFAIAVLAHPRNTHTRQGGDLFGLGIHRAALFESLLAAATKAGVDIVPGHTVSAAGCDDGMVGFTDEATPLQGPFDLIVDASGAHSKVSSLRSRPLPFGAVWGTVAWPGDGETRLRYHELRQVHRRADRMVGILPIGRVPSEIRSDLEGASGAEPATRRSAAIFWSLPSGMAVTVDGASGSADVWWPFACDGANLIPFHTRARQTPTTTGWRPAWMHGRRRWLLSGPTLSPLLPR